MNNAAVAGEATNNDADDRFEPFRVFFDRTFDDMFATAVEITDDGPGDSPGDRELQAAQLCATAYGKAFARWPVLGRAGDADQFINRRITKPRTLRRTTSPSIEVGVGYKPWVYVTATESGTVRKRAFWALGTAATTIVLGVGAIAWTEPQPPGTQVSTETDVLESPTNTPEARPSPPVVTTVAPPSTAPADDETWTGFTLNLEGLPSSPAEVEDAKPQATAPDETIPTLRFTPGPTVPLTIP